MNLLNKNCVRMNDIKIKNLTVHGTLNLSFKNLIISYGKTNEPNKSRDLSKNYFFTIS